MSVVIGAIIRKIATDKGISQVQLGQMLNLHEKTIYSIYRRTSIDTDLLVKFSVALQYDFFQHFYHTDTIRNLHQNMAEDKKVIEELNRKLKDRDVYIKVLEQLNESQNKVMALQEERARYALEEKEKAKKSKSS